MVSTRSSSRHEAAHSQETLEVAPVPFLLESVPLAEPVPPAGVKHSHIPDGPCTSSWSYYSKVPEECLTREEVCLGVDEAGRGPVLGPMVYAVSYMPIAKRDELAKIGFADSKVLKEEQRDALFANLLNHASWIGWAVYTCSPQDISECMLRKSKHNLNELAHDTTMELIRQTIKLGVNVAEVYVDTVGPPESYQRKLEQNFPRIRFTVAKKADSLYPCVSAASICAKVTRDAILRDWLYVENSLITSRKFGSGYPSDPNTVDWLKSNVDPVFGFPRLMRFSWSTCTKLLEDKGVPVKWADDIAQESTDIRELWKNKENTADSKNIARDPLFLDLKPVRGVL